jgi:hypothetical protein
MTQVIISKIHPNQRIGFWTTLEPTSYRSQSTKRSKIRYCWICRCACGITRRVLEQHLLNGRSLSCGCREVMRGTHHLSGTHVYANWCEMNQRCFNPENAKFEHYGGRGITVCKRWVESIVNFLADMGMPPPKHTIERIDVNGNYEPDNCKWVTRKAQNRNRRNNHYVTINGEKKCLIAWCEHYQIPYGRVHSRLKYGWDIMSALTRPKGFILFPSHH